MDRTYQTWDRTYQTGSIQPNDHNSNTSATMQIYGATVRKLYIGLSKLP